MIKDISQRIIQEADYILETKCTVRDAATRFGLSKSTVHADVSYKLKKLDYNKYLEIQSLMDYHFSIRHLRGGEATKQKYSAVVNEE